MQDILGSVIPKKRSAMTKVVPAVARCSKAARLDSPAADAPAADARAPDRSVEGAATAQTEDK